MDFLMGNKKRVTFADLLGFSLVSVVEIAPRSKPQSLAVHLPVKRSVKLHVQRPYLRCAFEQPVDKEDFMDRVKQQWVCLESVVCEKTVVRGFVRVLNVAFTKDVTIRYTTDGWKTVRNDRAHYLSTSGNNGTTDTFFFCIPLPSVIWKDRSKMEFAVCYRVAGNDYWDNNFLRNYAVCCASEEYDTDDGVRVIRLGRVQH